MSPAMLKYLRDRDQHKAFLAGACLANPTNMKEKETKTQGNWERLGGDIAHVQSEWPFASKMIERRD